MRTINEINADLVTVAGQLTALRAQRQTLEAQRSQLFRERETAIAAIEIVKLERTARDEYLARVEAEEAEEAAKAEEPPPEEPAPE